MKNQQQHRKELAIFSRDFLNGSNKHLHDVIDNYKPLLAQIDIQHMDITQETFHQSFKSISRQLFNLRPTSESYIIALLGFALQLHEYHLSYHCSWYHVDILIMSLADILEDINFKPTKELINKTTNCMIL